MFHKMRNQMKFVIIIVLAAMVGGGLWAAGVSLFGGLQTFRQRLLLRWLNERPNHFAL